MSYPGSRLLLRAEPAELTLHSCDLRLRMLAAGWRRRDVREVAADVGIFAPMAIPEDLQRVLAHRPR